MNSEICGKDGVTFGAMSDEKAVKKRVWRWRKEPLKQVALSRDSSGRKRTSWVVREVDAEMGKHITQEEREVAVKQCAVKNSWL